MATKLKKVFAGMQSFASRQETSPQHNPSENSNNSATPIMSMQDNPKPPYDPSKAPRFLVIGAGHRGNAYARAIKSSTNGIVAAVADIHHFKRNTFGDRYGVKETLRFSDWKELLTEDAKTKLSDAGGIDGLLVCTLDQTHAEIATALIPLGYHILIEKPLATTYQDCLNIQRAVESADCIFAIGHVLRYSPHNRLMFRLLTEEKIVGEIVAVEHKEPVGWYHFSHSYVRGNWHNEALSAPSILTKCCHDIDLLLWLLCSPTPYDPENPSTAAHLPDKIYSTGQLTHFRKNNKPKAATDNCTTCPASVERSCMYSAKKIYIENPSGLEGGYNTDWPVDIVYPEIETDNKPFEGKKEELIRRLADGPYGRCVYDGHNDVVDNQVVVINWKGEESNAEGSAYATKRNPKTATLTMTAFSKAVCERKTVVYGTTGELHSDTSWPTSTRSSKNKYDEPQTSLHSISFLDPLAEWVTHTPSSVDVFSGHGGGDTGLAVAFVEAVEAVKVHGWDVGKAQREIIGAGVDEAVRAHGLAWCAEESRKSELPLKWSEWELRQRSGANH